MPAERAAQLRPVGRRRRQRHLGRHLQGPGLGHRRGLLPGPARPRLDATRSRQPVPGTGRRTPSRRRYAMRRARSSHLLGLALRRRRSPAPRTRDERRDRRSWPDYDPLRRPEARGAAGEDRRRRRLRRPRTSTSGRTTNYARHLGGRGALPAREALQGALPPADGVHRAGPGHPRARARRDGQDRLHRPDHAHRLGGHRRQEPRGGPGHPDAPGRAAGHRGGQRARRLPRSGRSPSSWSSATTTACGAPRATRSSSMAYKDKVWAILGTIDGANSHIAIRVALKAEILMINTGDTDPTFIETNIPWVARVHRRRPPAGATCWSTTCTASWASSGSASSGPATATAASACARSATAAAASAARSPSRWPTRWAQTTSRCSWSG